MKVLGFVSDRFRMMLRMRGKYASIRFSDDDGDRDRLKEYIKSTFH